MHHAMKPTPMKGRFFTPGVIVLSILALNGVGFLLFRFLFGIGSITNLNNQYPWGIWIGIDVAGGVALAAGGFTTAALVYLMNREEYHVLMRPALLTALLGYTFVALGVNIDIGRWYYIWHPIFMWNGNSALFEVGICVTMYLTVLYIEFLPIVVERIMGKVNLPGKLSKLNNPLEKLLQFMDRTLSKTMFIFIIAGVVLSTLHQSSLGTLMVIAGPKMHPLWQTPILPLLFLLSAIAVGFPMVIFESLLASKSLGLKPEMHVLSGLASYVAPVLSIYLAFKIGDMFIRETFVYLAQLSKESVMFIIEILVGIIIPLRMFYSKPVLKSPRLLLLASFLVVLGVAINRVNNFIISYSPPYSYGPYIPSLGEISVTVGFIALLVLIYRTVVFIFPVISVYDENYKPVMKYTIRELKK